MARSRKQRGDSRLKTLKEDLQEVIATKCAEGKYDDVRRWLKAEWNIATSVGALSEFFSWYCLRQRLEKAHNHTNHLEQLINEEGLAIEPNKLRDVMNGVFLNVASASGDFETFEAAFKLLLKAQKQALDERKVTLLEKKAAQAEEAEKLLKDQSLSTAQKQARMKEVFGIS
jgi:hypothetical protein